VARYATAEDWAEVYDLDAPVGVAHVPLPSVFEGIGLTYWIHVRRDGRYLVTYLPQVPRERIAGTVVLREAVTWAAAMDAVRDAIQRDLDAATTRYRHEARP
jgi:hypothetical protein